MSVFTQFQQVKQAVAQAAADAGRDPTGISLVAVSKTYDADHIRPVLDAGHRVFGENRVQEAKQKWPALRQAYSGLELHLIGPLQSNKAAEAIGLFDVIQTVDRPRIAEALAHEMNKQGRHPQLFVQVNTGLEPQKAGIAPAELTTFMQLLRNDLGLTISGLMCIPPADAPALPHFQMLRELGQTHGLTQLSMGMSGDFGDAISAGATHVRVGSAIFGARDYKTP